MFNQSINGRFGRNNEDAVFGATINVSAAAPGTSNVHMTLPEAVREGNMDAGTAFALGTALIAASGRQPTTAPAPTPQVTTAPTLPFDPYRLRVDAPEHADDPSLAVWYDDALIGTLEPVTKVTGYTFVVE